MFSNSASAVRNLHWTKYICYLTGKKSSELPKFGDYIEYIFCVYIKTKYPDQQNLERLSKFFSD